MVLLSMVLVRGNVWSLQSPGNPKFIVLTYTTHNLPPGNPKRTEWSFLEVTAVLNTLDGPYQSIGTLKIITLDSQKLRQNDLEC